VSSPAIVTRANKTFSLSKLGFIARAMLNLDAEHACSVGICGWCAPGTEVGRNGEVTCGVSSPVIVTRANETFSLSMLGFIARVMHNLDAEHACSVGICGWCDHKTEIGCNG
jgi:hypothetical protein